MSAHISTMTDDPKYTNDDTTTIREHSLKSVHDGVSGSRHSYAGQMHALRLRFSALDLQIPNIASHSHISHYYEYQHSKPNIYYNILIIAIYKMII